ncbi:DegT/DnrJ/EryC1/StrS aminotransferase family protein [Actinophytocola sp.]|uniref:DegT/DnrJ/EryC1/StrS family aminotransferase n=1 Tax=Actinophytocola sp. TaxID=1872138 RepID=UPI002D717EA8|nr:DegT/DnrJ/EryC1/StrS aminotransferase family protein [Actinophytocola sp.]HYQ68682.1 DegT/DnrJ/EryC1/StrS aminotransferase family protein [Actinophytocola sp.]
MTRLAIDGGRPVRSTPLPGWPAYGPEDIEAAGQVLASGRVNYWTGVHGRAFEDELAAAVGTRYAVAVANGTVALELALHAVGTGPGDEVIVPAATFVATASAVVACGARPVVVDVDADTMTMTARTAAPAITGRTAAIVVVHLAGHPADLEPLRALADDHHLPLVEDCAQAHGASYRGRPVGGLGDIGAWSFCQDKIISTAGEGGAVTTSDPELWRRCWERKDHGKSWAAVHEPPGPGFHWVHHDFGTNGRMTEIQAAVGRNQLRKLSAWTKQRTANAAVLIDTMRAEPAVHVPEPAEGAGHAYYRFYARVRPRRLARGWDRDRLVAAVAAEGIPARQGGCMEVYRERAFRRFPDAPRILPIAAELGRTCFSLPVHPTLEPSDVDDMAAAVVKVLREATA